MSITRQLVLSLSAYVAFTVGADAATTFTDVTQDAGLTRSGESFGASWADVNGDGWTDLWATNHLLPPALYINQGDGSFIDVAASVGVQGHREDLHGAAWADFDNDGDQDLLQTTGASPTTGEESSLLLVNTNGNFSDETGLRGLELPLGRGRTPLWFDRNGDGLLDALVAGVTPQPGQAPVTVYRQSNGVFVDDTQVLGIATTSDAFFAQILGVAGVDLPTLLVHAPAYPQAAYRYDTTPLQNVSSTLGLSPAVGGTVQDVAIADFDGNLERDLFIVRHSDAADLVSLNASEFRARLSVRTTEQGIEIRSSGDLTLEVSPDFWVPLNQIYIGAAGAQPVSHSFTLSAANAANQGWSAHVPGVDNGLYVGRDPVEPIWRIYLSQAGFVAADIAGTVTTVIDELNPLGFSPSDGRQSDRFLKRSAGVYSDASGAAGLGVDTPCDSIGSGDFDNDMDVDVYLVCRGMATNADNVYLDNQGNGSFVEVAAAGGAIGSTEGRGDGVVVADYDADGFLDLYVTNGYALGNFNNGPDQLFRNNGNANHWLQLDLVGVRANRDAIGARVIALAGGKLQVRGQGGGIHRYSQDSNRLHFGLAANTKADALIVQWPNGSQQAIANIPADQIVQINQRSAPSVTGQPVFTPGISRGVYLWRDGGGTWRLRVSGNSAGAQYTIRVVSAAPVTITGSVALEGNDALASNPAGFALTANVASDVDGVDFQLYTGATTLISVERDGIRDPRDLHVGASGAPLTPAGWVTFVDALPTLPAFSAGNDLGLYIGRNASTINARWSADVNTHAVTLLLLSGGPMSAAASVGFEAGDNLNAGFFNVFAQSTISGDADGLDVTVIPGTLLGLVYYQDTLFQSHRVNAQTRDLGLPNAYLIR